jgi:fibronectin type 3 domain-containing protein
MVAGGQILVELPALSAILLASGAVDLAPPAPPTNLRVTAESANTLELAWNAVSGAAGYDVWLSPVSGGGYVKANDVPVTGTSFTATGLDNARPYHVVVRALDAAGNASDASNEVVGLPHLTIGWANLQWPPSMTHTISSIDRTDDAYGQVWIDGVTPEAGAAPGLIAQLGFGPDGSNPDGSAAWTWVAATFNTNAGNNDEFVASLLPESTGTYDYLYRYSVTGGRDWLYADLNGPVPAGQQPANPGSLTVNASDDTTAPAAPTGLTVVSASPAGIELRWDAVADASLHGYEIHRADATGGPYTVVGTTGEATFTDTGVAESETFWYVVRALDTSFNRSGASNEVQATAELRSVTVTFTVTVPASTDATGRAVTVAGTLDRLDGNHPQWSPGATPLSRIDATTWSRTFTGLEGTQLAYKYVLDDGGGDWTYVEKDANCGEIGDRQLTLSWGTDGTQAVNDVALNWRNVPPCGN